MVIYGEVEAGAGYCVVVSSAEGFAGVDCCDQLCRLRIWSFTHSQEKETFSNNKVVRFGGCSHSADPKCITR